MIQTCATSAKINDKIKKIDTPKLMLWFPSFKFLKSFFLCKIKCKQTKNLWQKDRVLIPFHRCRDTTFH